MRDTHETLSRAEAAAAKAVLRVKALPLAAARAFSASATSLVETASARFMRANSMAFLAVTKSISARRTAVAAAA